MARRRNNTFNRKLIEAMICTPAIVLGSTKRTRRSAARKWLSVVNQALKK